MALFQLLYMSSLVANDTEALPAILEASVRNNKQRAITGMLLYSDGNILQVLEGEKDTVIETFLNIQSDARHRGIYTVIESEIPERQFVSWSMGFKYLKAAELDKFPAAAQLFKVHPDAIAQRAMPGDALMVLQSFVQG